MTTALLSEHSRQFETLRFAYPVVSRRSRGLSLGLNVNPDKLCNFDCPYCQVDRSVAPRDAAVDFDVMISEIDGLMALAASGAIWQTGRFAATPEQFRRINDVAFAGDGEPTTYERLGDAIREVHNLRLKHGLPDVKIIVLTNALLLHKPEVLAALRELKAGPYEVWAKLDAGSQAYFEYISGRHVNLRRIVENITVAARELEVTIQTMIPTVDGKDCGDAEAAAIGEKVQEIKAAGGKLRLVQVYTTARRPSEATIGMIEDSRLDELAGVIQSKTVVPVEVYYGRQWD